MILSSSVADVKVRFDTYDDMILKYALTPKIEVELEIDVW